MDDILEILQNDARITPAEISKMTGKKTSDIEKSIKKYEKDGVIVKYKTVLNRDLIEDNSSSVRAFI